MMGRLLPIHKSVNKFPHFEKKLQRSKLYFHGNNKFCGCLNWINDNGKDFISEINKSINLLV